MADPAYSKEDAEHYGRPLCNRNKVLAECHRILKVSGYLVWLDQSQPMYSKIYWNWVGVVSIFRSTNHRVRAAFFFQRASPTSDLSQPKLVSQPELVLHPEEANWTEHS
jgi:hypothetical protein